MKFNPKFKVGQIVKVIDYHEMDYFVGRIIKVVYDQNNLTFEYTVFDLNEDGYGPYEALEVDDGQEIIPLLKEEYETYEVIES
jgi:hypothetical protein